MATDSWIAAVRCDGLTPPTIAPSHTGQGITIAVVDSGINFDHPHLRLPANGSSVLWIDERVEARPAGFGDRYGHGTCCAALIHRLAPDAEIVAIRVTDEDGTTDADRLAEGITEATRRGAHVISVSLGTHTLLRARLDTAVEQASTAGAVVVAAAPTPPLPLPAGCPGAVPVSHLDGVDVVRSGDALMAEGRARPAEGHPSNFWGPSLATARAAAAFARFGQKSGLVGVELLRGFSKALVVM